MTEVSTSNVQNKNIYKRILQVMEEVEYIQKQDSNSGMRYKFVSHDSVMSVLHKPMVKAGIVFAYTTDFYGHNGNFHELKITCGLINSDNPEDKLVSVIQIPSKFTHDEKGYGASLSYAIKYFLLKTFMLETGEDADANTGDDEKDKKQKIIPKQVYSQPNKQNENIQKALVLNDRISQVIPSTIPTTFVRDYMVSIMRSKNLSWEATQEEAVKNISAFLNALDKKYKLALEQKDNADKLSKIA